MAFRGTFDYSLDAKNRLTVPAKFRAQLAGPVVLAKGSERCVAIWTREAFDAYTSAVLEDFHPLSNQAETLKRFFSSGSMDTELDGAGRVMIPSFLQRYAGLEKEVVVTGAHDRLEIWNREAWARYDDALGGDVDEIRAALSQAAGHAA